MAFSIHALSPFVEKELLYDQTFRRLLEGYLPWLRDHTSTQLISVDPHHVYKYEGDFYGLLDELGVHKPLHWLTLRMNDRYRAGDVDQELKWLLIPDLTLIGTLKQLYQRKKRHSMSTS